MSFFIENKTSDHIKLGKQLKHYVYPPVTILDVIDFKDDLKEIIPQKLEELLNRAQDLKKERDAWLRVFSSTTKVNSFEQYFWVSLTIYEFAEYYVIQKWINYWLFLWYAITNEQFSKNLTNQLNKIDKADINKAKQNPIQNFCDGQLRKLGLRLVILCPFHKEKTPSFNIYTQTNTYFCFGCQSKGDSISFIQKTKNLTFSEAVRYLL